MNPLGDHVCPTHYSCEASQSWNQHPVQGFLQDSGTITFAIFLLLLCLTIIGVCWIFRPRR